MRVFVVGAGPVATAIAGGLHRAAAQSEAPSGLNLSVSGLWARRPEQAESAAAIAQVPWYAGASLEALAHAEVIVFAVRDDATDAVASKFYREQVIGAHQVLLHCSGSRSAVQALGRFADLVDGIGTLHPLRAVTDAALVMRDFQNTVFGVEGTEKGKSVARQLVHALGGSVLELRADQMSAYHTAAVMMSNFIVALTDASTEVLRQAGVEANTALPGLLALSQGAVSNVALRGIEEGLTGPIRRGDKDTIGKHLEALAKCPENLREIYRTLAMRNLEISRRVGVAAPEDLASVEEKLEELHKPA